MGRRIWATRAEALVQVQDTSLANARSVVLGETVNQGLIKAPIPFSVEKDAGDFKPSDRISPSVCVALKGKLLSINGTNFPAVTSAGGIKDIKRAKS